jgi:hypothetical protein
LTEQGRKQLDEAFDKLDELVERWNNRLTLDNLDLAKRYLKNELRVHVHLRYWVVSAAGEDSVDFCAIFQRECFLEPHHFSGLADHLFEVAFVPGVEKLVQGECIDSARVRHADGHQELVFVRDVELVEPPERVARSLVRFGFLDEVHRTFRRSLYLSGSAGFKSIGVPGLTAEHGESGVIVDGFVLGTNHLANEQVESGTQVVDAVPGDGAPQERRLFGDFDPVDQISRMRLVIMNDSVRLVLLEPLVSGLEVTEVMFGPFDLYPNTGEIGLAGHERYNVGIIASKRSKRT